MVKDWEIMRIDISFRELVEAFKAEFEQIHGIRISDKDATKIIKQKIDKAGGLAIE